MVRLCRVKCFFANRNVLYRYKGLSCGVEGSPSRYSRSFVLLECVLSRGPFGYCWLSFIVSVEASLDLASVFCVDFCGISVVFCWLLLVNGSLAVWFRLVSGRISLTVFWFWSFFAGSVLNKMADWSLPRKARKSNFSTDEVDVLVDSVKSHFNVLYGKFAKRATNRWIRQKAWLDILKKVNGVSIEKRTLQEVKNKWKKCQYALKEQVSRGSLADDAGGSSWDDMGCFLLKTAENRKKMARRRRAKRSDETYEAMMAANITKNPNVKDSMPLQERLSKVAAQEKIASGSAGQVLKSQPLSPTKLKVTRSPKVTKPVEPPQSPVNEEMCLRWNSHHSNMQTAFPSILSKEQYVDVTLAAEGKTLKCHRLILSSCSPYFEEILSGISPFQHPVLFMRDIPFWILKSLCDFMYAGEVHIYQNKLEELLTVAEALKIKGLAGKSTPPENQEEQSTRNENTNSNNNYNNNNKEVKKKQPPEKEKTQYHRHQHLKKNSGFAKSNNFESTSHDFDDDLLDPLDLLEPLYEEVAEEKKPSTIVKPKENKYQYQPVKKPFGRKLRKRKYSEQREPSPPPVFSFRKGTRSRPNVKIPKYYHSDYNLAKPAPNTPSDPLMDVDEIKTEPIDVEDNNLVDYSDEDHYLENSLEPANCNSPIIITNAKPSLPQAKFKKIKLTKPVITEVHTIEEPNTTTGGLEVIKITVQQPEDTSNRKDEVVNQDPLQSELPEKMEIPVEPVIQEEEMREEIPENSAPPEETEVAEEETELPEKEAEVVTEKETENVVGEVTEEETEPVVENEIVEEVVVTENNLERPVSEKADDEGVIEGDSKEEETEAEATVTEENTLEVTIEGNVVVEPESGTEEVANNNSIAECEEEVSVQEIQIQDVRSTLEELDDETEEERRTTSLDHLEKEAMNVANAINLENQAGPPDIE